MAKKKIKNNEELNLFLEADNIGDLLDKGFSIAKTATGVAIGGAGLLGIGVFKSISNLRKAKKVKKMTLGIGTQKLNYEEDKIAIAKKKAGLEKIDNPEKVKKLKEEIKKETEKFHAQDEIKKSNIEKAEKELSDKIGGSKYLGKIHQKYKTDMEAAITKLKLNNAEILKLAPDKLKELKLKQRELLNTSNELEAGLKNETDRLKNDTKDIKPNVTKKIEPLVDKISGINKTISQIAKDISDAGGDIKDEEIEQKKKKQEKEKPDDKKTDNKKKKNLNIFKKENLSESASEKISDLEKELYKLLYKRQTLISDIHKILGKDDDRIASQKKEKEYLEKLKDIGGSVDPETVKKDKQKNESTVTNIRNTLVKYNIL